MRTLFRPAVLMSLLVLGASGVHAAPGERFPSTRTQLLSGGKLAAMSAADRRYAINEIYARHGFSFGDLAVRKQFLNFSWYRPLPGQTMAQTQAKMSRVERQNLERLSIAREIERGSTKSDDYDDGSSAPYVSPYAGTKRALPGEHFPETRLATLDDDDISQMSDAQIRYARNEIYARHGYVFQNMTLRKQFLGLSWYHPKPGRSMAQIEATFSKTEAVNLKNLAP